MKHTKTWLLYIFALLAINCSRNMINSKAIIWDLGNTLISTNKFGLATEIGLTDLFISSIFNGYSQNQMQQDMFYFLDLALPSKKRKYHPKSHDGQFLPEIMCGWLEGKISHTEISNKVNSCLNNYYRSGYLLPLYRRRIIQNSINAIFNPEILANNMYAIEPALYLLDKCSNRSRSINQIGNSCRLQEELNKSSIKHEMFILSNLESKTFKYFKETHAGKKILRHFKPDHVILSGDVKLTKPDPEIYRYLLKKFKLNPENCIFIDDQLENITTAKKLGIDALYLNNQNYHLLQKQLESRNII